MSENVTMWSILGAVTNGKVTELTGKMETSGHSGRTYFRSDRWTQMLVGQDVFDSEQGAIAAAKVKVAKRIASLEKSLAKARKNPLAQEPQA